MSGIDYYVLERSKAGSSFFQFVYQGDDRTYIDVNDFSPLTRYVYRLKACRSSDSVCSEPSTVEVTTFLYEPPYAPMVNLDGSDIVVSWLSIQGAQYYFLRRNIQYSDSNGDMQVKTKYTSLINGNTYTESKSDVLGLESDVFSVSYEVEIKGSE